jgi:hypothetical protein
MGIFDKLADVGRALTPQPAEDFLFGHDERPPTPTDPEQARRLIDNVIGREPDDAHTLNVLRKVGLTSTGLTALENVALQTLPYDPVTHTRMATNNMRLPVEPYVLADQVLGNWLQENPRRQTLYLRETDPLNKDFLPYVVEANAQHHAGLLERFRNSVTDIVARPIGGALELLAKPAQEVETWYGTHFVWNDIGDASLRHAMARYTYEAKLNLADWDMTWERDARQKAREIEAAGLKGDAAAQAFEEWVKSDAGHTKVSAAVTDMIAQMVFDPLWFAPTHLIGTGFKAGGKVLLGTEDLSKLARLTTAAGRSYAGEHTLQELLRLPEIQYAERKLATPASRGALLWLTERNPDRLADAALNKTASLLSGPLYNAKSPYEKLQIIARYNEAMRTGKVEGKAAELFGADLLDDPVLAEAHVHLRNAEAKGEQGFMAGLVEGLQKNPEYLQAPHEEQSFLMLNHVLGNVRRVVREGQLSVYPSWFAKRYLPLVAAQKAALGVFTLSRPGFVVLNMANNLFTFMWHAAGHPMTASEIFARSFKSELSTISKSGGHLPEYFRNLARAADIDPVAVERTVVGNVSHQDVLGQKLGYPFRLDDEAVDVADAIAKAQRIVRQPVKDMNPRRFRDLLAFPVTIAGRVDRVARRAFFYYNLREQLYLGRAPEHLLTRGVAGAKGGLLPNIKEDLVKAGVPADFADHASHAISDRLGSYLRAGGSLGDAAALRKAYLGAVDDLLKDTKAARLSAQDLGMKFMRRLGYSDEQALIALTDLDEPMARVQEVLSKADDMPIEQVRAGLDKIADDYWTFDRLQAEMTKTDPVIRPGNDYSAQLSLTEEGLRQDLADSMMHLERYMNTKVPEWAGNAATRRRVVNTAREYSIGRLERLADIRRYYINSLAEGVDKKVLAGQLRKKWEDYFAFTDEIDRNLYNAVREQVAAVDTSALEPIEKWYQNLTRTRERHRAIIADAVSKGTPEGWEEAGKEVKRLYERMANRRAADFGWEVNEAAQNLGHTRPSAAFTRQVDEYIDFVKGRLGEEMAKERPEGYVNAMRNLMQQHALEVGKRGPELARHLVANARAKTDFGMLNYNNQYGLDNVFQSVFPFEFFPTRTAMNWLIRTWRQPGAGAALAKALLLPYDYQKQYGLPDRLAFRVPVLLPGLDVFLSNIPVIGEKVKNAEFGPVYWIDPIGVLFPMSNFRNDFVDEQKRSTPMGIVADWMEQNTPLSLSPFAKIVGGVSGALDRDAWTTSLFNGGPFGIPLNAYANAAMSFIQLGAPNGLPENEQELYTDKGYFSSNWFTRMLNMAPDRYDTYRAERALASLVAEGKLDPDDAWDAMKTHTGPAWKQAVEAADSEKFLADFTGWLGLRIVGSQRGEQIRLGERALYSKAVQRGELDSFYEKYPEFELQQAATKGLSDPEARQQMIDNHGYFRDLDRLVNKPYEQALTQINAELEAIRRQPVIRETDKERQRYLLDELQQIREEQQTIREQLDRAYPNRKKEASLSMPPRERALQKVADGYHAIQAEGDETPDDLAAKRERFLAQFPAKTADDTEQDWQAIFVAYQTTQARFNLQINAAYNKGDFDRAEALRAKRDKELKAIHAIAESRVTRYDAEQYLASFERPLTPSEVEWEQANALFDLWMSYMSDSSPLTDRQKAAVSAFFRSDPLLRKHYNVQTIDIRQLNGDQLAALARRREIKNHYYNLKTNAARIDYIQSVKPEYDAINAMLGLPPLDVLDYRPAPPGIAYSNPEWDAEEFGNLNNALDYQLGADDPIPPGFSDITLRALSRAEGGLSLNDVTRYVDPVVQRGY